MEYDLLVVGNGFDLGSGFKTDYASFIKSMNSSGSSTSLIHFYFSAYDRNYMINDEWNGFENLLCQYLQFIDFLFKENDNVVSYFADDYDDFYGNKIYRYYKWEIKDISKLPNNIFNILCLLNPLGDILSISTDERFYRGFSRLDDYPESSHLYIRMLINAKPVNTSKEYVLEQLLSKLEEKLSDVEQKLKDYIYRVTTDDTNGPTAFSRHTAKRIVSFNYSKTAQKLYNLSDDNVAYVHGDISNEVVLGVEPSMIHNQSFAEESNYIKFFKRFRRIYKDCNKSYNYKIIEKLSPESNIAIYGHSLDLGDRSILKPLFENRYKKYDIYCYDDKKNYKLKLVKLIGLDLYDELEKEDKINFINIL